MVFTGNSFDFIQIEEIATNQERENQFVRGLIIFKSKS